MFFYCCVHIRCRGNVFTDPFPPLISLFRLSGVMPQYKHTFHFSKYEENLCKSLGDRVIYTELNRWLSWLRLSYNTSNFIITLHLPRQLWPSSEIQKQSVHFGICFPSCLPLPQVETGAMLFWTLSRRGAFRVGCNHVTKAWKVVFYDSLTWNLVILLECSCYSRKLLQDETIYTYVSITAHGKLQIFREIFDIYSDNIKKYINTIKE
jgi:hypothetical protein